MIRMAVGTLSAYCTFWMPSTICRRLYTKAANTPHLQPYRQDRITRGSMEHTVMPPPSAQGPWKGNMLSTVAMASIMALSTRRRSRMDWARRVTAVEFILVSS